MNLQTDRDQGLTGDRVMVTAIVVSFAIALAIGAEYEQFRLAAAIGSVLAAGGLVGWWLNPGTLFSRLMLTTAQVLLVALHIQLGRGTTEFHFGVFVTLGLLMVYVDWRPLLLAAGLFAVHHVGFDRLQAAGLPFYCTPSASFLKVLMHAGYVVAQTAAEIYMTIWMSRLSATARASSDRLHATLNKLENVMSISHGHVSKIDSTSDEIARGNDELNGRTEQTAARLQQAAASMDELTSAVRATAESAANANSLAVETASSAEKGGEIVSEVVSKMGDITASSRRIADIIGVIDSIAFQTNILALNAAVEAARAGDQGRGFAVVATEVRSLAQRSAESAREIKSLISGSVENVESGAALVGQAGKAMESIVKGARGVAEVINQISTAASHQSNGIVHVQATVAELDQMTQQNATLVEQSAASADNLRSLARTLAETMASLPAVARS